MKNKIYFILIALCIFSFSNKAFAYSTEHLTTDGTQITSCPDFPSALQIYVGRNNTTGNLGLYGGATVCTNVNVSNVTGNLGASPNGYVLYEGDGTLDFHSDYNYPSGAIGATGLLAVGLFHITSGVMTIDAPTITSSITPSTPADGATNVNAYINFSGTYDNDGTYNVIDILIQKTSGDPSPLVIDVCDIPAVGTSLTYSCNYSGSISSDYSYVAVLDDGSSPPLSHAIDGQGSVPYTFSTGTVYIPPPSFGGVDCSTFDIGCYLQQAIQWLFYPDQQSIDQFSGLYNLVIHKPPFGYVTAINAELTNINDTNTSAFTLQSLPILNTYIFDPLRTGLAWLLWFGFAYDLFHRLKNIHL